MEEAEVKALETLEDQKKLLQDANSKILLELKDVGPKVTRPLKAKELKCKRDETKDEGSVKRQKWEDMDEAWPANLGEEEIPIKETATDQAKDWKIQKSALERGGEEALESCANSICKGAVKEVVVSTLGEELQTHFFAGICNPWMVQQTPRSKNNM